MKVLKIHLIEIAAALLFVILALALYPADREIPGMAEDISYNEDWTVVAGQNTQEYAKLPKELDIVDGEQEIILKKRLPEQINFVNSIGFYTSHQLADVFINGEKVYECKVPDKAKSRTTGN